RGRASGRCASPRGRSGRRAAGGTPRDRARRPGPASPDARAGRRAPPRGDRSRRSRRGRRGLPWRSSAVLLPRTVQWYNGTVTWHKPMPRAAAAVQSSDTRELILEAALVAFADDGFDGATTRDIAQQAGVALGLLRYHFGSKTELWKAAVDRAFAELGANL